MIWIIALAVSVFFNIIYCVIVLMKNEYIRRADNMVKMRDDRIEELLESIEIKEERINVKENHIRFLRKKLRLDET